MRTPIVVIDLLPGSGVVSTQSTTWLPGCVVTSQCVTAHARRSRPRLVHSDALRRPAVRSNRQEASTLATRPHRTSVVLVDNSGELRALYRYSFDRSGLRGCR